MQINWDNFLNKTVKIEYKEPLHIRGLRKNKLSKELKVTIFKYENNLYYKIGKQKAFLIKYLACSYIKNVITE